ncbi:MAG: phosphoribosylformylglycinamidine synthase subunit PurS [Bacteroidetes bacterium]|nr:phosphoribosylformylglycinamidine synthase subunit PurS [Bacteroidota bacterium]
MKFQVEIDIMPLDEILDPQGKVVQRSLGNLDLKGIEGVRIGKHINFKIEAETKEAASATVEEACKKLLANVIVEKYEYTLTEV